MSENELIQLYSKRIMSLAASIALVERLEAQDFSNTLTSITRRAPFCGSSITVDIVMQNDKIAHFAQEVKACVLGQASASILSRHIIGSDEEQLTKLRASVFHMLTQNGPPPPKPFHEYEVFMAAKPYTNRHGSILLAIDTALEACQLAKQKQRI